MVIKLGSLQPTIKQERVDKKLGKQLAGAYANQATTIPTIIHYCWMGKKQKSKSVLKCRASWKQHLPHYQIIEWNEKNFNLDYNDYLHEASRHKKWAFVSDVVRLYALYHYGGIYFDTDIEILKPLDNFLNHKAFASFEAGNSDLPPFIQTGLMASEKQGEWVKGFLYTYQSRHFVLPDGQLHLLPNTTPITDYTVDKYGLVRSDEFQDLGAVTLYPSEYFCPKNWHTQQTQITEHSYAIHHYAGSWVE